MSFFIENNFSLPPAFLLFFGALFLPFLTHNARRIMILTLPIITLIAVWVVAYEPQANLSYQLKLLGHSLEFLKVGNYTLIFATAFSLAAMGGGLFALKHHNKFEICFAYIYASCAIGITFAGDWLAIFIMWEVMAVASMMVIIYGGMQKSVKAAMRYALMHFVGGAIFLVGLTANYLYTSSFDFVAFDIDWHDWLNWGELSYQHIAAMCIFIAILVNVAAPPFSSWMADSYPESSPWGGVFLSAFTSKTAVFTMLSAFAGNGSLIYIGVFMIFYGIIYAMLENNLRRILSYSIVNQVGFMMVGIGIGTPLALAGVAAHAFCHIMYKGLLFMSAGSVIVMTGKHNCNEVGGLYRTMKFTTFAGIVGALAISAFPYTSGFISKSLITSAAANEHLTFVWLMLLAASAGVFLHAGVKFPWFAFYQKDSGLRPNDPPLNMRLAMAMLVLLCIIPGVFPQLVYSMLPLEITYEPYTLTHVIYQLQLLLFSGLAFFALLPLMKRTNTISLDWDFFTRKLIQGFLINVSNFIIYIRNIMTDFCAISLRKISPSVLHYFGSKGILAKTWKISDTVLYLIVLLGFMLLVVFSF